MKAGLCLLLAALLLGSGSLQAAPSDLGQRLCQAYKERLKRYQLEGVKSYDLLTGKTRKLDAREARTIIEETREYMKIFCDEQGVVR